jgi:hypothetical protein
MLMDRIASPSVVSEPDEVEALRMELAAFVSSVVRFHLPPGRTIPEARAVLRRLTEIFREKSHDLDHAE